MKFEFTKFETRNTAADSVKRMRTDNLMCMQLSFTKDGKALHKTLNVLELGTDFIQLCTYEGDFTRNGQPVVAVRQFLLCLQQEFCRSFANKVVFWPPLRGFPTRRSWGYSVRAFAR